MQPDSELWLDAQLSPALVSFIAQLSGISCVAVRDLGLRDANDVDIFNQGKNHLSSVIIITKDADFLDLLIRYGSPPKIIFLTCGNTSNVVLKEIFSLRLIEALDLLKNADNDLVEISD